ncbi:hypothetical protein [Kocuria rhizosphaericola]|uniref:hypothetical protein n=1 Tax=Kocuria rhizosphaericola TaxID=3376284 RepID=UPI0037B1741B
MNTLKMRRRRSIHLIDIENQLGTPFFCAEQVNAWFDDYVHLVDYQTGDLIVVGTTARPTVWELERSTVPCRKLFRLGPDGADRVLQEVMWEENLPTRFDRIVCASGDGGFTDVVAALGAAGGHVVVVSQLSRLSKRLRLAAAEVITLPEDRFYTPPATQQAA